MVRQLAGFVGLVAIAVLATPALAGGGVALDSIAPDRQRVHDWVELRGAGFGSYVAGVSRVLFEGGGVTVEGGVPYVWRDDYIRLRVPTGDRVDGVNTPIPRTMLAVSVVAPGGRSGPVPFRVISRSDNRLTFVQRTLIQANRDVSGFLGPPEHNIARTKDGEVADVDADGWPDLIDNNSNNVRNGTHAVVRLNRGDGTGFDAFELEPLDPDDTGDYLTVIPEGGDYMGDKTTYDADVVDLNNDGYGDYVQTAARGAEDHRLRILLNNYKGTAGRFIEDTASWLATDNFDGCPDDLDHADLNADGWIDVVTSLRTIFGECGGPTGSFMLFFNEDGTTFADPARYMAPSGISAHDVLILDANHDGHNDIMLVMEESPKSQIFLHDGNADPTFNETIDVPFHGFSADAADYNADGVIDFSICGLNEASLFLNDPDDPGSFTETSLDDPTFGMYDMENGDIDLNGAIDIVMSAIIADGDDSLRVYLNDGTGSFTNATSPGARSLLPGNADYQRLSGDLIDFDGDGDLDLYVTGADSQDVGEGGGFGRVPNQFWQNLLPCFGDLIPNGAVDFDDLLALLAAWGPCEGGCPEDLDGDEEVGFSDLLALLAAWGPC